MLYLEDFFVGQSFRSEQYPVSEQEICAFAERYDPQPFHLDADAAELSHFAGLAASGWHTAAITMRLMVTSPLRPAGGVIGAGVEELRWLKPVRPGDVLEARMDVVQTRPMASEPGRGLVKLTVSTLNQRGETVQQFTCTLVVRRLRRDLLHSHIEHRTLGQIPDLHGNAFLPAPA
jgi:acyl dehydratase